MTALLEATALEKSFLKDEKRIVALRDFDLAVDEGSFVTILGRSGCGKSTLLNMMAGLLTPSAGQVTYRGRPVLGPQRELAYLTQHDTLMPWRNLQRNVEMPLELRGVGKSERREEARRLIDSVGLSGFERHFPRELSGGMRRRAGLARMLSLEPETFLMDEPFGALDAQLRGELQVELLRLWQGSGRTVVFVTHDVEEALLLGDRIVVLGRVGRITLDVRVDIRRPRDADDVRAAPAFVDLHRRISGALKEEEEVVTA